MHRYTVTIAQEIEADSAEEAAMLMYAELTRRPPLAYAVTDAATAGIIVTLDREKADEFASVDHTADPGNW